MCGISGIINFQGEAVSKEAIRTMMQSMKYRGPDDEGLFAEDNVGLGFVRLSILDLSPSGHQPMFSPDGRYVLVFNGEIFNYLELKEELRQKGHSFESQTDSEVLLKAYLEWGEDCLHRFNGMWAFVIYDRKSKQAFAARDRYGIKPFYYYVDDRQLIFASDIPAILKILNAKPTPNYQAIFDYLVFNRTDQTESTFFSEVRKLQHGCQLKVNNGSHHIQKWYDLRTQVGVATPFESASEFKELFNSSIGLRLRSDVPIGVCLSGGLDSSSIVSTLLKDYQKEDLNTFSAVYEKGQYGDETEFIQEFSPLLKNMFYITPSASTLADDLQHFVVTHGEPIPSTSPYAQYKVMQLAKKHVVVTLDGQGADEELAGYHYFFGFFFKDLLRRMRLGKLSSEVFHYLVKHHSLYGIKTFLYFLLPKQMRTSLRVGEKGYFNPDFVNQYQSNNTIAGNLYAANTLNDALLDHFEYKLEHLLKWEDRNSMCFSLEARVPFLDYRLVEKLLATSGDLVIKKGMTKHLLREGMKGLLPEKIRMRKDKIGFDTPQDDWFRNTQWQEIVREVLNSRTFRERNLIDPRKAQLQYEKHLAKEVNISKEIWKWIHLEYWFRTYIDE
jgi:asparagine synthase (glutamine-hydrolysing)